FRLAILVEIPTLLGLHLERYIANLWFLVKLDTITWLPVAQSSSAFLVKLSISSALGSFSSPSILDISTSIITTTFLSKIFCDRLNCSTALLNKSKFGIDFCLYLVLRIITFFL